MVRINYILLLLLFMPLAFAVDVAYVGQEATLWCNIREDGLPLSVDNASTYVYLPDGTLSQIQNGTYKDVGVYSVDYTPTITGNHLFVCDFYKSGNITGTATETLVVKQEGINMEAFTLLVIFGIGATLFFLGGYLGYVLLHYAGSVWFIINSFYALNTLDGFANIGFIFFLLTGIGLLFYAIGMQREISTEKKYRWLRDDQ